jgi:PKHD-type hydroxylase
MFFMPTPSRPATTNPLPTFVAVDGIFSNAELDQINAMAMKLPGKPVAVGRDQAVNPEVNRSTVRWLEPNRETERLYQGILNAISILNSQVYQFDIHGIDEPLYHVTYPASNQGHYAWHVDQALRNAPARKLSITFQMTDPGEYEGGDLEFNARGEIEKAPRGRGKLVLFPSYLLHRVTPVTRGSRSALVTWIVGPKFR